MFTSGDAPDLLIGYRSTYLEFVDKDLLAPLNTSLDKYGTHLKELVEEELWGTVTYGGKIYAVPNPEHQMEYKEGFAFHGGPALMYRADVLKELGLEPPTTTE